MSQAEMTSTNPRTMNNILSTPMTVSSSTYNVDKGAGKSEKRYKISMTIPDTSIAPFLTLPPFMTQFSEFSENGDAETFGKNLDDGKMSISLRCGIPTERVGKAMPMLSADQSSCIAKLRAYHEQMVLHAFVTLPKKGPGSCSFANRARSQAKKEAKDSDMDAAAIEARASEIYLENAHCGGIVEREWEENGTTKTGELLVIKRKVTSYEKGVKGRYPPVFHKVDFSGTYYAVEVGNYLQRDTLVQTRARPQFFTAPSMYGTTLSLDRDVIIVWRPKAKRRLMESVVVPAFLDGDDEEEDMEPSSKRVRTE